MTGPNFGEQAHGELARTFAQMEPAEQQQWLIDETARSLDPNPYRHSLDTLIAVGDTAPSGWSPAREAVSRAALSDSVPITERIEGLAAVGRWLEPNMPSLAMEKRDQAWQLALAALDPNNFQGIEARQAALHYCLQTDPDVRTLAALARKIDGMPILERGELLLPIAKAFVTAGDLTGGGVRFGFQEDSDALLIAKIDSMAASADYERARAELASLSPISVAIPRITLKIALAFQDETEINKALEIVKEKIPALSFDHQIKIVEDLLAAKRVAEATEIARQIPSLRKTHSLLYGQPLVAIADHYLALPEGREPARPILEELRAAATAIIVATDKKMKDTTDTKLRDYYLEYVRKEYETFIDTVMLKEAQSFITTQDAAAAITVFEVAPFYQTTIAENDPSAERVAAFAVALAEQGHLNEAIDYALRLPTGSDATCSSPKGRGLRGETFARLAQIHRQRRMEQIGPRISMVGPEVAT